LIHVMPTRLPPETVQQWCQDEREQIVRYAAALAQEQAARRGIEVWRGMHAKCRDRMIGMQSDDAERLREALRDGELAATQAHEAAGRTERDHVTLHRPVRDHVSSLRHLTLHDGAAIAAALEDPELFGHRVKRGWQASADWTRPTPVR
jgi:hypothetical protein